MRYKPKSAAALHIALGGFAFLEISRVRTSVRKAPNLDGGKEAARERAARTLVRQFTRGRMSADINDARLGCFLGWRFWLCRKLKHGCLLTLA
jgi:hypothetical protein